MAKKKSKVVKKETYASPAQRDAVIAIVTFLLNYSDKEDLDQVSKQTLQLAIDTYAKLVDAEETPGASYRFTWKDND